MLSFVIKPGATVSMVSGRMGQKLAAIEYNSRAYRAYMTVGAEFTPLHRVRPALSGLCGY